jgi:hypothetical protein
MTPPRPCECRPGQPPCRHCTAHGPPPRSLPCLHLGPVLDRRGCLCPAKWLRGCGLHGQCTVEVCKGCPDYESEY